MPFLFFFLFLQLLFGSALVKVELADDQPVVSPHDGREYRAVTLTEGSGSGALRCLLVHDSLADSAAAGMHVGAGTLDNSAERGFHAGDAHFLEHMLFLGSDKFPGENEFASQLAAHAGYDNAFTASDETVYYFVVSPAGLNYTLEVWAQFFVAPLLTADSTAREAGAVNAEHAKNVNNDEWRRYSLIKQAANPSSAFARFGTGTFETLLGVTSSTPVSDQVATAASERLRRFFDWHYVPPNLRLVVVSPATLDQTQAAVLSAFASLVVERAAAADAATHTAATDYAQAPAGFPFSPERAVLPFGPAQRGQWLRAIPDTQSLKRLTVYFPLPADDRQLKPAAIVQYFINRKDDKSLLAALRNLGLAISLGSYVEEETSEFTLLAISLQLTESGASDPFVPAALVFAYLRLFAADGSSTASSAMAQVYREQAALAHIDWMFSDRPSPDTTVVDLSRGLARYGSKDAVRGANLLFGVDGDDGQFSTSGAAVARFFTDHMVDPSNCVFVFERALQSDEPSPLPDQKTLQYYGAHYTVRPLTTGEIEFLSNETVSDPGQQPTLHSPIAIPASVGWPASNPFVAQEFDLLPSSANDAEPKSLLPLRSGDQQQMSAISSNPIVSLAYHQTVGSGTYNSPKLVVRGRLTAPVFFPHYGNPDHVGDVLIYVSLVNSLAKQQFGAALDAGLSFAVGHHEQTGSLDLSVSGFSDPQSAPLLLNQFAAFVVNWTALGNPSANAVADQRAKVISALDATAHDLLARTALREQGRLLSAPLTVDRQRVRDVLHGRAAASTSSPGVAETERDALQSIANSARLFARLDFLSVGNVDGTKAASLLTNMVSSLAAPVAAARDAAMHNTAGSSDGDNHRQTIRPVALDAGARFLYEKPTIKDERNSAVALYIQVGGGRPGAIGGSAATEQDRAIMRFLSPVVAERAFHQLRTVDGLGYVVWAYAGVAHGQGGLVVAVQSAVASNARVTDRIDWFLEHNFLPAIRAVCQAPADGDQGQGSVKYGNETLPAFNQMVQAAVTKRLQRPQSLGDLAARQWAAVTSGSLDFEPSAGVRDADALRSLTRTDVLQFLDQYMAPATQRRFLVWLTPDTTVEGSAGHGEPDLAASTQRIRNAYSPITNVDAWHSSQRLGSEVLPVEQRLALERSVSTDEQQHPPSQTGVGDQPAATVFVTVPAVAAAAPPTVEPPPCPGQQPSSPPPPQHQAPHFMSGAGNSTATVLGVIAVGEFLVIVGFLFWLRQKRPSSGPAFNRLREEQTNLKRI